MSPPKIFIFHNPVAGNSNPEQVKTEITEILTEQSIPHQFHKTEPNEDLCELAKRAAKNGYEWVWAAGGDGTVSAVANGLINTQSILGIIPTGSGNVLARELGIPINISEACHLHLESSRTRQIDAIRIGKKYFFLAVSAGIGARIMKETKRPQKRILGGLAYIFNGIRLWFSRTLWPFNVTVDGLSYQIRATEVIAANAGIIGYKYFRWSKNARLDDGIVNLCFLKANTIKNLFNVIRGTALDQQEQITELICLSANDEIQITSRNILEVQGDGEPLDTTPVHMEVIPQAITVLAPVQKDR